jgi:hypothetical protein
VAMNVSPLPLPPARTPQASAQASGILRRLAGSSDVAEDSSVAEPSLLQILTPEERAFFEQQMALGPLTYRVGGGTENDRPTAPTGQRIDVRG